jgi:hypothetical protein
MFPQKSHVEIVTPDVMALECWVLRSYLGPKGGALKNEISNLIKETPERAHVLSVM